MPQQEHGHKSRQLAQSSLRIFLIGWLAIWAADLLISHRIVAISQGSLGWTRWIMLAAILPTLQFIWIRRALKTRLIAWAPLALVGNLLGSFLFSQYLDTMNATFTFSTSESGFFPVTQMPPGYASHLLITYFLISSAPLILQWLALLRRFRFHTLWLLAALVVTPLQYALFGGNGIFKSALRLFDVATGHALLMNQKLSGPIATVADYLDEAIPIALMGLALYVVVTHSRRADTQTLKDG